MQPEILETVGTALGRSGEEWGGVGRPPDGPAVQESERVRLYCNDVMAGTSCDPLL